jgi:energy-coupling factor transporter ATP-binding protein EcfA2
MVLTRRAAITTAILVAAGFVALRVAYRIVFGGAGGSGPVLLDLPRIRLDGPFEHITLLGEVTTGGIAAAAVSALPFAALVLVIGVLAAVVDLRGALTRGASRGPVRSIARALVIALATVPALVTVVRRVRVARELRGERGLASLLVPVFEQTVERAVALGAAMELRGFAASRRVDPVCEAPALARSVSLGYGDAALLEHLDLDLTPGTLTLVTGATGSGKSTLLDALSGRLQHVAAGDQTGLLEVAGVDRRAVPPRETAGFVGVVAQSVRSSFVAATVSEELGFALTIRGVASELVHARVQEVAARVGITGLLDRDIHALSAGEACLVAIAAALVQHPVLLLVDEPLADLDDDARSRVVALLDRLAYEAGVCVVVAEHREREWGSAPDRILRIEQGQLVPADGTSAAIESVVLECPSPRRSGDVVAQLRDVSATFGDRLVVEPVSLDLRAGEVVALRGPNGAGKSSLLHAIARPVVRGRVLVDGRDVAARRPRRRRELVALVPEDLDDLFFASTVAEECRRADRRGFARTADRFLALLGRADSEAILARHPRDLSAGERLVLALAIQLSASPRVLLVDEPSRGLDAAARRLVADALVRAAGAGAAVVIATHDRAFADSLATLTITMADGRLSTPVPA